MKSLSNQEQLRYAGEMDKYEFIHTWHRLWREPSMQEGNCASIPRSAEYYRLTLMWLLNKLLYIQNVDEIRSHDIEHF